MWKLYEIFKVLKVQKRIVSAEIGYLDLICLHWVSVVRAYTACAAAHSLGTFTVETKACFEWAEC